MVNDQICPKCQGAMRGYERNRVNIEQCADCRGIFLDRGELEQLLDAEAAYHQAEHSRAAPSGRPTGEHGYGHGGRHGSGHGGHPKRRKSFLSELFE